MIKILVSVFLISVLIVFRKTCNKTIEFLQDDSVKRIYRDAVSLVLWFALNGWLFWLVHRELNVSDEACIAILLIWFLLFVTGCFLMKILPDGNFRRTFGFIFFVVTFLPAFAACCRLLGKDFRAWGRHIMRGVGAVIAISKKTKKKVPLKRKSIVDKRNP